MPSKGGPNIITDGLVFAVDAADANSYPGSGTTWKDWSGNGNDGTLVNGPTFDSGNGGSIVFDGSDDYVGLSDFGLPTTSFSCMCVFKFDTTTNGNTLFNLNYSYPNSGYLIRQISGGNIIVFTDNGTETSIQSTSTINNNQIYHLTITQNSGTCTIYLNGIQDKQVSLADPVLNSSAETSLARRGAPSIGAYLNGNIYTSKIYNRALSPTEISQNYNALKGRFGL